MAAAAAAQPNAATTQAEPLLPFELMDAAEQRTWVVSGFVLLQSFKLWQCVDMFFLTDDAITASGSPWLFVKWCAIDALLIGYAIPRLRLPKLDWPWLSRLLLLAPLLLLNWLLFSSAAWQWLASIPTALFAGILPDYRLAIDEHRVRYGRLQDPTEHILGKHTVHVLPHASAKLAPQAPSFCLPVNDKKASIAIPLIFNNTSPHSVQYSITDPVTNEKTFFDVSEHQIRAKAAAHAAPRPEDQDDWGLPTKPSEQSKLLTSSLGGKYSHVLQISQPGLLRLERLLSVSPYAEIPFSRLDSVLIVSCPTAKLDSAPTTDVCQGVSSEAQIRVSGVPPLALEYHKFAPTSSSSTSSAATASVHSLPETLKLEGITPPQVLTEGQAVDLQVPIDVRLQQAGKHRFELSKITDKYGNDVVLDESNDQNKKKRKSAASSNAWEVTVHGSFSANLQGCSPRQPLKLLENAQVQIGLSIDDAIPGEGPYQASVLYPDGSTKTVAVSESRQPQTRPVKSLELSEPGQYELLGVSGRFCEGQVKSPLSCPVTYQPPPTLDLNFTTLNDACAGSIGLKTSALLTGEPPFKLHYQVTHKQDRLRERTTTHSRVMHNTHEEIIFQPEQIGSYTWQALRLEDASYKGAQAQDLRSNPQLQAKTTVHPLASARWDQKKEEDARNCEGKTVQTKVALTGDAPFTLEYQVQYGNKRETKVVRDLKSNTATIDVDIPSKLDKNGGTMTLSLTKITDGRNCQRSLQTDDRVIHVRRTKPTAKIHYTGKGSHLARIRQGSDVSLPLRLTGEGPWTLKYRRTTAGQHHDREVKLQSPSSELLVNQQGTYKLLSVHDKFCGGSIIEDHPFRVEHIAKPTLAVKVDEKGARSSAWLSSLESFKRAPVCVNTPDSVELSLTGAPPFRVQYNIISEGIKTEKSLLAVQNTAHLFLTTDTPGRVEYEITGVSDSVYESPRDGTLFGLSSTKHVNVVRLEQQILALPTGTFANNAKPPKACVNSPLAGKDTGLALKLVGQAPFDVELEIGSPATSSSNKRFTVRDIKTNDWPVELPDYQMTLAGKHEIKVISVRDAKGCKGTVDRSAFTKEKSKDDFALVRQQQQSPMAVVDVLESASIIPARAGKDVCVGENLDFILQGSPPFSVSYEWEGKVRSVPVRNTLFSRVAEKAGTFKVTGVAHQQTQCQTPADIEKIIHSIPRVRVDNKVEDIREGDRTEIKFSFVGTPPFTFTYTRSHPLRPEEILEEKTITGILDDSYSVYASSEGVWEVKFISDAYCSFPPVRKSGARS